MATKLAAESHIGQYTFHSPVRAQISPGTKMPCFCCARPITLPHVRGIESISGNAYHFHVCCWNSNSDLADGISAAIRQEQWEREHAKVWPVY